MDLRDFFEGLTPEQRKRFGSCMDDASIVAFAKEEGLALPDDFLEKVAGGLDDFHMGTCVRRGNEIMCIECGNDDSSRIKIIDSRTGYAYCENCRAFIMIVDR